MAATNYRKTPNARPWAKQLDAGDLLTTVQAGCVDPTRLRDFGLMVITVQTGSKVVRANYR